MDVLTVNSTRDPAAQVCRAARGCYMPENPYRMEMEEVMAGYTRAGENADTQEKVSHLISGLLTRGHFGPFEHVQITFGIEGISRVTLAQLTRHRLASFDVQSFRYTAPDLQDIEDMAQDITIVDEYIVIPEAVRELGCEDSFRLSCIQQFQTYKAILEMAEEQGYPEKRAKEDARYALPKALKCNLTMTVNARMLMHIADMRAAGDAQWEIREMTDEILDKSEKWFPECFEVYESELKNRKNRLAP